MLSNHKKNTTNAEQCVGYNSCSMLQAKNEDFQTKYSSCLLISHLHDDHKSVVQIRVSHVLWRWISIFVEGFGGKKIKIKRATFVGHSFNIGFQPSNLDKTMYPLLLFINTNLTSMCYPGIIRFNTLYILLILNWYTFVIDKYSLHNIGAQTSQVSNTNHISKETFI